MLTAATLPVVWAVERNYVVPRVAYCIVLLARYQVNLKYKLKGWLHMIIGLLHASPAYRCSINTNLCRQKMHHMQTAFTMQAIGKRLG